jgi:DNA-binding response OmpR family regulator
VANPLNRVLIIDEDTAVTDILKMILEKEPFEIVMAGSGREGIAVAKTQEINAIILNLKLASDENWEVFKMLRGICQAPIILLTALNSPRIVARALDAGADEILTKPVAAGMLVAHIKRLTKRAQAEKDASLIVPLYKT